MDLEELKIEAASLFPKASRFAVEHPGHPNPFLEALKKLCQLHFPEIGFDCLADCFAEAVPQVQDSLSLEAWCDAELDVSGWRVRVRMRPFYLGASYAHFEIRHAGPIPAFTETGYQSVFTPMSTFAELTPLEFLEMSVPKILTEQQLTLL